uniref:Uncharacterized protein n=1 Tax=Romanomermis culicivorax TaxID=13658 RepID=A0A915J7L0_ROMCU
MFSTTYSKSSTVYNSFFMPPNCSIDKDFKLGNFTGTFRNCLLDKSPVEKEDKFGHRSKTTSINLEKALTVDDEHGTPVI